MVKISGIIPQSSRVKSVDISSAHPVRSGAPDPFKIGSGKEQRDRIAFSESLLDKPDLQASTYTSSGKLKTNDFFENRLKAYDAQASTSTIADVLKSEVKEEMALEAINEQAQSEAPEEFQNLQEKQFHEAP